MSSRTAPDRRPAEHLILYDGVCGLCNGLVQFVLARDRRGWFDFAALQSDIGRATLRKFGRDPDDLSTFALVTDYQRAPVLLTKSAAALAVSALLGQPWRALAVIGRLFPRAFRDWWYDRVAAVRYRVFGRYDTCPIPSPEQRRRFLDA